MGYPACGPSTMMKRSQRYPPTALLLAGLALLVPATADATISFTQIDDEVFVVSHRVKIIGSRGKATKMVYTKAASLCVAAGYSHLQVLHEESEANQADDTANASLRVRFYFEDAGDRIDCEDGADPVYIAEAQEKLRKQGYDPPEAPDPGMSETDAEEVGVAGGGVCTLEQIAAMARTGLSDDQIRAACAEE